MDYNLDIPNIYKDVHELINKDYILNIIDIDMKELYNFNRIYLNTTKSILLLVKTNINNSFLYISDIHLYNNLIYFPDETITQIKIFYNSDSNLDCDKHFIKIYNIQRVTKLNKLNKFIKCNHYDYNTYCTDDKTMLIFKKSINMTFIMTFTIHITTNKKINKLKKIKLKSNDLIFIYNPILINDTNIILNLTGLQKINTDDFIKIDIKFNDIDNIYDKYKNSIENIKKFFNNDYEGNYEIEVKYLENFVKGIYHPYCLCV